MTTPWEDRRGLFQRGKEVHEPGRRLSQSASDAAGSVAAAVRKASISSTSGSPLSKTTSNSSASASPSSDTRRRSSTSSGLFGNLQQAKRGSEDYHDRRASHHDQLASVGMLGGWFNSTFRGVKPAQAAMKDDGKRGVME